MTRECTVYYRTYGGENNADRPSWYSKDLCLRSILRAVRHLKTTTNVNFVVLHDGPMDIDSNWGRSLNGLVASIGTIKQLAKQTNAVSCLKAVEGACGLPSDQIVIFAEDDYLWMESSLTGMVNVLTDMSADYVTGYDHPVRYQPDYPKGADLPHWHNGIALIGDRHWRSQESTCMTFGARVPTLQNDIALFERYHDNGKNTPNDRELFRHLQGLGNYSDVANRRLLLGPMPSLNTHVNLPWLAPLIDWESLAQSIMMSECES